MEPSDVLAVLEPIWTVKYETATRVKQRIGAVEFHPFDAEKGLANW